MKAPMVATLAIVFAAAVTAGCSTPGAGAGTAADPGTVTATATGTATGTPDTLTVSLGVESRARSAQDALARNADRAGKVIAALQAAGVDRADIQTSELSIWPNIDRDGGITGYTATNIVTVRTGRIGDAGAVIDAAAGPAGDDIRIRGLRLSIDDDGELMTRARTEAVRRARAQATQLARAAGVSLGEVRRITESRDGPRPWALEAGDAAGRMMDTPIEPGTQEVSVRVRIVYALR